MESQTPQGTSDVHPVDSVPSPACNLCGRVVQSASDDVVDPEIFSLCGDCKFLLLEDFGTPAPPLTRARRRMIRRRRSRRSRHHQSSSESVTDQQQFTHLITLARQQGGLDDHQQQRTSSHNTTPTGSARWRLFSESESDDSRFAETESNASFSLYRFSHGGDNNDAISFSAYGGDSDAEIFIQQGNRSDIDFDTDIDPMRAGLNQWADSEDEEWEEADGEERAGPSGVSNYSSMTRFDSPELDRGFRRRIIERRQALSRNIFTGLEDMEFSPYVAAGDYLDERGFEELLEQLADSDNSRRGAPPASVSCVRNLPKVSIVEEHVKKGLVCAVCKELYTLGNETTQLPCLHLYHAHCIVPWLSARNSCPLCRYELPTDDKEYEEGKQNLVVVDVDVSDEDSSSSSSSNDYVTEAAAAAAAAGEEEYIERGVSRGRWLFLAAAPVVSLVGVVLAMWLSNPQRRDLVISHTQRGNRTRRWLPFF